MKPVLHRVLLAAALVPGACASATAERSAPPAPDNAGLEALYRARTDSARLRFTEADARFMTDMLNHHAQAVAMAELAPERAADPGVLTLAARILSSQVDEIRIMQQWLRERGLPVPPADQVHAHGDALHPMPGMLTPDEMRELAASRGADFDRLFLARMIRHHRGAVIMVHQLFATDGAGQDDVVFRFASDVQVDQRTEIARMEHMLAGMRGSRQHSLQRTPNRGRS